ncbi:MAG: gamma carbonic anhydrase family protein [Planctomycetaceae bacterium]|nr:gamma carbonic anhydrase family protein [Planctomycetaceae bacterium]
MNEESTPSPADLPAPPEVPYPEVPHIWEALHAEPEIDPTAWVAPTATMIGRVKLGRRATILFGTVLRGDGEPIVVGDESNIQDLSVLHTDRGHPCLVGNRVTIGHRAIVHGCEIEDDVMIGMGAIVLTGARIGCGALIAAGSVVLEGTQVPPRTLWAGVPARQLRTLSDDQQGRLTHAWQHYANSGALYKALENTDE